MFNKAHMEASTDCQQQLRLGNTEMRQVYGVHHYHLLICDALGLDHTWYAVVDSVKNDERAHAP
ncbi:MAG TPA: hypothetical protein VIH59_30470 [Candidatus Tectomicrobia bacterium]